MSEDNARQREELQKLATELLWNWLTNADREAETIAYVEESLGLALSGRVTLVQSGEVEYGKGGVPPATVSKAGLSLLAVRLSNSFGLEADCYGDLETWPQYAAAHVGMAVDWHGLAARLLTRYAVEYVPGEAGGAAEGDDD
jgi:hypothetical protein